MALTYDEYWRKKALENQVGITATDAYRSALDYAETKYDNSVSAAGNAYTAASSAAETALGQNQALVSDAYRRDLATYGRKAEALAQSGLTGSGYSDNLARDAYASRQQGMSEAQLAYSKALTDAASAKELAIGAAKDEKLANEYSATAAYQTALAEVEKNAADTALTRTELLDIVNSADTSAPDEVERALLGGVITADEANTYRDAWNAAINPNSAFTVDGASMPKEDADALLRAYKSNPWADATKVAALEDKYREIYEGDTSEGQRLGQVYTGQTIQIVTNERGSKAKMKVGKAVTSPNVLSAASNLADGAVFTYGVSKYLKQGDKVYHLVAH